MCLSNPLQNRQNAVEQFHVNIICLLRCPAKAFRRDCIGVITFEFAKRVLLSAEFFSSPDEGSYFFARAFSLSVSALMMARYSLNNGISSSCSSLMLPPS